MAENYSESKVRVRYAETDAMGIVYHANYYVWFEVGRGDFMRNFDMSYKHMEKEGIMLPVVESHCRYRMPAQYDDLLTIRTEVKELGAVKISFRYQILRDSDNALLAEGETVHAFTDKSKKPINLRKNYGELYEIIAKAAGIQQE